MITIIDYGMGNLGSIQNMLKRIGVESEISSDKNSILSAKKIILPGVGAFDQAMSAINSSFLREILEYKANEEKIPILGICLGMQLLTRLSEEGNLQGLGWIEAQTKKFPLLPKLKIPHMGWNNVTISNHDVILDGLNIDSRFYFVHSYYVTVSDPSTSLMKSHHGITFDSVVKKNNIYGAQFHPEKSHKFGMKILDNFARLVC